MDTIYCVFVARGGSYNETIFDLLKICRSVDSAKKVVVKNLTTYVDKSSSMVDPVHDDMKRGVFTFEGHPALDGPYYMLIGKRSECRQTCSPNKLGGYVIEEMTIE